MFEAQLRQWVRENVGEAGITLDDHGHRVVEYADPVIRVNPGWLVNHGVSDIVQPDGGLVLDSAGHYRYTLRYQLPDGFNAYERM
jgi:hypothetical protein